MAEETQNITQATEQGVASNAEGDPKSTQSAAGGASSAGGTSSAVNAENPTETKTEAAPQYKFTQEDMNKAITDRLERQRKQLEKQYAEEKAEAEKLAKMTADQKAEHERQKREKELADREAEITRREMAAVAKEQLAAKNIPAALLNAVDITSAETITQSVEEVSKAFNDAVAAEVAKKLAGDPPKASRTTDSMAAIRAAAGL